MVILIDGYNLLKRIIGPVTLETQRKSFIARLRRYSAKKKHTIVLVFDGGITNFVSKEIELGLTIIHSGYKQLADDVIKDYLADHAGTEELVLITSDRELRSFAQKLSVESIASDDFFKLLKAAEEETKTSLKKTIQKDIAYKLSEQENPELDILMVATNIQEKKEDFEHSLKYIKRPELSKKEKRRQALMKKL